MARLITRLSEEENVFVEYVKLEPFSTFPERFAEKAKAGFNVSFTSHCFFRSANVL
jgi:hypothetical protein